MTAHALMFVDKATFYRFIQTADEQHRHEYVRGWIMQQQAGGTRKHAQIAVAFCAMLRQLLDPAIWAVTGSDRLADTGDTIRYADALVERRDTASDDSISTEMPVLIVEVLSPSSEERDLSVKPTEYMALASLEAYIVASQDEVLCYVWQRRADGKFAQEPRTFKGRDHVIQVPGLGIAIPLAEVYRGIAV